MRIAGAILIALGLLWIAIVVYGSGMLSIGRVSPHDLVPAWIGVALIGAGIVAMVRG